MLSVMESHDEGAPTPPVGRDEALAALSMAQNASAQVASRAASPRGYYLVLGIAAGLLCLGGSLLHDQRWLGAGLVVLAGVLLVADMAWYTRSTGMVAMASLRDPGAWRAWLMI